MSFLNFFSKVGTSQPASTSPSEAAHLGSHEQITKSDSKIITIQQANLSCITTAQTSSETLTEKKIQEMTSPEISLDDEKALTAIGAENIFPSLAQKEKTMQMAALAGLMYKDFKELKEMEHLFPGGVFLLPSPQDLGIDMPKGLRAQAFRHGDEVIIAMRGTELNLDGSTMLANLIADLGIGRHKSNEDLIFSVREVAAKLKRLYGYDIGEGVLSTFESIVNQRVTGDSDTDRMISLSKDMAVEGGKAAAIGIGVGGGVGGIAAGTLAVLGLAAPPLAIGLAIAAMTAGATLGGGIGATKTVAIKGLTLGDGYATLQSYFKALDAYIMILKEKKIRSSDTVITTGHSLAGFLSGVIGTVHADEAFSFNGPGVLIDSDVKKTMQNLGVNRLISGDCTYTSVVMEGDFIGNLGKREGYGRKLYLPITFGNPAQGMPVCSYTDPLAHHGILLMQAMLSNSTVQSIPKSLGLPVLLLKDRAENEPRVEEINE